MNNHGKNDPVKISQISFDPNKNEFFVKHLGVLIDVKMSTKYHFDKLYYHILCGYWHIIACKNHTGITFTE